MTQEALKLALEALDLVNIEFVCNGAHHAKKDRHGLDEDCPVTMRYRKAIAAIKEALAQPQRTEQEPVARRDVIVVNLMREGINKHRARELAEHIIKLTHPPQQELVCVCGAVWEGQELVETPSQRTWAGLTVEEIAACCMESTTTQLSFYNAIEAKLKEKNT